MISKKQLTMVNLYKTTNKNCFTTSTYLGDRSSCWNSSIELDLYDLRGSERLRFFMGLNFSCFFDLDRR